jgi:hypothetical protein
MMYLILSLAHRGASPETVLKAEQVWRLAAAARNRRLGRLGSRPPGTMTRAARSSLHVLRRKCRGRKRGPEAENRHGGAPRGARPDRKGRRAPRRVPGLQRHKRVHARLGRTLRANRVPLHPGACRRSAHPSIGVDPPSPRLWRARSLARRSFSEGGTVQGPDANASRD